MRKLLNHISPAIFFFFTAAAVFAQDTGFSASVNANRLSLGQSIQLSLTFHNIRSIPAPELPEIKNFESRYLGRSTMMSMVNYKVSRSIVHNYTLIPLKAGKFSIPSLTVNWKGKSYTSKPIPIEVVKGPVTERRQAPAPYKTPAELGDRIFLSMAAGKKSAYINEVIPVTIKLYVNSLRVEGIQLPRFAHEAFSGGQFEKPKQYQEANNGILYHVIEFKTLIYGIKQGEFTIGPAQLKCSILVKKARQRRSRSFFDFDDFFGGYQSYSMDLKSEEIPITVLPFPEEGKPEHFNGAVGDFQFFAGADPRELKVGDPITLKMQIEGDGNLAAVNCPELKNTEGFKTYSPQTKQENNTKTFEQIIMPITDTVREIPEIVFSFFAPQQREYKTVKRGPIPIAVKKPEKEEELRIIEMPKSVSKLFGKEKLGRDIIYIKQSPGKLNKKGIFLYRNRTFLLLQIVPLLTLLCITFVCKRAEKLKTDTRYARRIHAPQKARKGIREARQALAGENPEEFYRVVSKTIREYLGGKFHLHSGGMTADIVDKILKSKGINKDILDKLKDIFRDCDTARYASSEFNKEQMETTFKKLQEVINRI